MAVRGSAEYAAVVSPVESYMHASVAAFAAYREVEHALRLIARRVTGLLSAPTQLLALRRYLRIAPIKLPRNWSWTNAELESKKAERTRKSGYAAAEMRAKGAGSRGRCSPPTSRGTGS